MLPSINNHFSYKKLLDTTKVFMINTEPIQLYFRQLYKDMKESFINVRQLLENIYLILKRIQKL